MEEAVETKAREKAKKRRPAEEEKNEMIGVSDATLGQGYS